MPRALASTHPLAAFSVVGFYPTRPCACGAHADLHEWGDGNTLIGMALVLRIRIHVINADVDSGVLPPVEVPAMFGDEYAAEGKRVVLLGASSTSYFRSAMNSELLTLGSTTYAWQSVESDAPSLAVWHASHPLSKGLPATIGQADFPRPEYAMRVGDTDARVACR